ncbi:hypothetical protein [Hymenobacter metallicola]|uniref:SH3 domain-containing protein n=1 Tax=Hymenobacter metallicola TaxID=2563114 RepID=A0A4Z0Q0F5_9BACT|nr:hypothetical protein [Hymenobacter metallicola]TGE23510.1 hypothetical protein E5K02_20195 [Hymenobacter metallicola]
MKKLFFLLSCLLVLGSAPAWAQTSEPDIVVVRVSEMPGGSRLVVTRGEGKSTTVDITNGYGNKVMVEASETYYRVVAGLYKEGYVLAGVLKSGDVYSTILFTKLSKP